MNYAVMCARATTEQGLDPIVARLTAESITHAVDQTGGYVMVVTVPARRAGSYGITRANDYDASYPLWLVTYRPSDDNDARVIKERATTDETLAVVDAEFWEDVTAVRMRTGDVLATGETVTRVEYHGEFAVSLHTDQGRRHTRGRYDFVSRRK